MPRSGSIRSGTHTSNIYPDPPPSGSNPIKTGFFRPTETARNGQIRSDRLLIRLLK